MAQTDGTLAHSKMAETVGLARLTLPVAEMLQLRSDHSTGL